jgi:hypothetical protein
MFKLSSLLIPAVAAIVASWLSGPAMATLVPNGVLDQGLAPNGINGQGLAPNGIQSQGLAPNGTLDQGRSPSGLATSFMTLHAIGLALPDGTGINLPLRS